MQIGLQQVQKLSQRLIMTPQMQQSVKLLQMNTIELENLVEAEMLENPFLEVESDSDEPTGEQAEDERNASDDSKVLEDRKREENSDETRQDDSYDTGPDTPQKKESSEDEDIDARAVEDQPEQFEEVDTDWGELFEEQFRSPSYSTPLDDSEERRFEETCASGTSLYEHLEWQLRVSALTGRDFEIGHYLIGCIDENGFLQNQSTIDECAERFEIPKGRILEILSLVEDTYFPGILEAEFDKTLAHDLKDKDLEAARFLAGYLRSNTLQRKPIIEHCAEQFGVRPVEVERVLYIIQEFEPTGVAARDLPESLCLQLAALDELDGLAKDVIIDHWPLLKKQRFRDIAKITGDTEQEVQSVYRKIQKCNPTPGRVYSKDRPVYISPDVYVRKLEGRYIVYLNEGQLTHLRLSKTYRDILLQDASDDAPAVDPKEKEYALEKYRAAQNLIRNIEKRRNTIFRVTEAIVDYQKEFFEKGVEALRPLALSEIADRVGMHESTISRVTSGKYVHTPRGLFELKYFFSSAIRSSEGEDTSSRAIRSRIRELIENEDPRKPLSDEKIAKALKNQGFSIARRTVAKYREQMKILPTSMRRVRD